MNPDQIAAIGASLIWFYIVGNIGFQSAYVAK